jgi:hypothetical protein
VRTEWKRDGERVGLSIEQILLKVSDQVDLTIMSH